MSIFDPKGNVTYDQAITMVMRALGYTEASLNGTYPACFVSKAVALGAMKNLHSGSGDANRADCAQLIYNVIQSPIGKVGNNNIWVAFGTGENGNVATNHEEVKMSYDTMLVRLGAHLAGSTVDCEGEEFYAEDENYAVVTMAMCEADSTLIDMKPLLGHKVSVYHNDDCEIVAVAEVKTTEITGKLKNGKIGDVKLTNDCVEEPEYTFLNGYEDTMEVKKGDDAVSYTWTVIMKGGKVSEIISCIDWVVNEDAKVEEKDLKSMFDEDDLTLLGLNFKTIEDEDEIDMDSFILEGVDSLEDIEENNVVYVYAGGDDNHITKIQVGTKVVAGVVDEVSSNGKKVTVEDTTYNIADQRTLENAIAAGDVNKWAEAGEEATLYMDVNGKFYTIDHEKAPETGYVVVLKTQVNDEDDTTGETDSIDGSNTNKISVFTAEGESKVYGVNVDKVNDKADPEKNKKDAKDYLAWDAVEGGEGNVVILTIGKNDKVVAIKEVKLEDSEGDINKKGVVVDKDYVLKDEKAVVFAFKDEDKKMKASNWSVVKASSIWNKEVETLSVNADEKGVVKVAVVSDGKATNGDVVYGVIKSYSEIKDYAKVQMLVNGEATTAKMKDEDAQDHEILGAPGQKLYAIELDGNEIVDITLFEADDEKTFEKALTITTTASAIDNLNRLWVEENGTNTWYSLDDEVAVYVYDKSDSAWTVKTVSYLNGLKLTKKEAEAQKTIDVKLYDTNDKDKEYYNVVIVVRP